MKKTLTLALAFVFVLALLTGCRWGQQDETSTPTTAPTTAPTTMPTTTPTTVPDIIPDDMIPTDGGNGATAGSDGIVETEPGRSHRPSATHY